MKYLKVPSIPPRFRSDSLDEVRHYIAGDDTEHSRELLGTGRLGWQHVLLSGAALQLHWVTQRLGQIARGGYSAGAVVHVPLQGTQQYWFGRRRLEVGKGDAVFIVPGQHYDVRTLPGSVFALGFSLDSLEREIKPYIRSANSVWQPRICKLSLAGATAIRMLQQVDELTGILISAEPVPEVVLEQSEGDVLASLAEVLADNGGAGRESKLTAERARAIEEWIEAPCAIPSRWDGCARWRKSVDVACRRPSWTGAAALRSSTWPSVVWKRLALC